MMRRPQSGKKRPKQNLDESALVWRSSPAGAAVREDFAPPLASARGRDRLAEWLTAIGRKGAAGEKLKSLLNDHPAADDLLGAVAEASPYLWDLVRADPRRTLRLLTANPDEAFAALLAEARRSAAAAPRQEDVMRSLAPHEGGSGAAHRACRYRRRLAGRARDAGAHRGRRDRARRRRAVSPWRGGQTRQAHAGRSATSRDRFRLHRAGNGQDGRPRAQLLQRH